MPSKEPAISEVIVAFDELDTITLCKAEFIRTSGDEFIWTRELAPLL